MDKLLLQVNPDNVLAAHKVFRQHSDDLRLYLAGLAATDFRKCGDDPVSADAMADTSFGGKVSNLIRVHRLHQEELEAVADRLYDTALSYGYTDEDIRKSMSAERS